MARSSSKKQQASAVAVTDAPARIVAYKGFNPQFQCAPNDTPFQFEVGKSYEVEGRISACSNGFHACQYPLSVFSYYPPSNGSESVNRFALVELEGDLDVDGDKTAARKITIVRELTIKEMTEAAVAYTEARLLSTKPGSNDEERGAATASGWQGAATASGPQGAATASGPRGAATASGWQGVATAAGYKGKVRGKEGNALFLVERNTSGEITAVWSGVAGRDGIKPDTFYQLADGKPVEVE